MEVSNFITSYLRNEGVKHVFGIPGGYVIALVSEISKSNDIEFVLTAHEGGAAYMAHGYSQVTHNFGVVITTAGPAALNALTGLAQASSDGDSVLLIHGTLPDSKLHLGVLQDTFSFQCDIADVIKSICVCQKYISSVGTFLEDFQEVDSYLTQKRSHPRSGAVHLQVACDVLMKDIPELDGDRDDLPSKSHRNRPISEHTLSLDIDAVTGILKKAKRPILYIGNGVYQAQAEQEVTRMANMLKIPVITTAKGAACIDCDSELLLGQHSIFPHLRPVKWLEMHEPDVIIALGTAFGAYGSNSFSGNLKRSHIIHVDKNPQVFGRGIGLNIDPSMRTYVNQELRAFVLALASRMSDEMELYKHLDQSEKITAFRTEFPNNWSRVVETLEDDSKLTGQRVVRELSQALRHLPKVNMVTDTGSSKLYASHYVDFRAGWHLFQPGGFDTMGYGVSAAIGVALGARDMDGDRAGLTVCVVGDGSLYMNNELSCVASSVNTSMLIFVLNDYRLSTVYQGFVVVNEQELGHELEFGQPVDMKKYVESLGLECVVIDAPERITRKFIDNLVQKNRPVVIECRIDRTTLGPGGERYNEVRAIMGKDALTPSEMNKVIADLDCPKIVRDVDGLRNTIYLYGDIRDVFVGCIVPPDLLNDHHYVERDMRFGIGVCSFSDDVADIADSCFVDGRFFVKHTAEGLMRSGVVNSEYGLKQRLLDQPVHAHVEYVAPYSLGFKDLQHYDMKYWYGSDETFGSRNKRPTMQDMLISFTGGIRGDASGENPRMVGESETAVGFIGICEFESWWGTSLLHAPIEGRNILKDIDYFARPGRDYGTRMGVVVGFAQRVLVDDPDVGNRELLERMFFENPHDRAKGNKRASDRNENVFRIASHTHGILVAEGEDIFSMDDGLSAVAGSGAINEKFIQNLQTDTAAREKFIERTFKRGFVDSSHVIPDAIIKRYMFMQFNVENVVVRGKYDNNLTFDLDQRVASDHD